MARLWLSFLVALLVALAAWGQTPAAETDKAAEEAAKAAAVFQSVYGDDLKRAAATKDTADDIALAAKLLEAAQAAEAQPALLVLLCDKACVLGAADPKGYETALAAANLLAGKVPDRASACQEKVLAIRQRQYDAARGDQRTAAGEALIEALLATAAARAEADDLEEAAKRYRQALVVARAVRSAKADEIEGDLKALTERQKVLAKVAGLESQLTAEPANGPVRDQLVLLLLVELDNPADAAKYLTDASDAALRKFIPAAAKPIEEAPELACAELGDWYRDLAAAAGATTGGKVNTLTRAQAYYERFLALHAAADMDRTRVELVLKKVEEELRRLRSNEKGRWIDLLKLIDPEKDAVKGQWQRTAAGLTVAPGQEARLLIPLAPSGSYELEYKAVRVSGREAGHTMLPAGSSAVLLVINGWKGTRSGLCNIGGKEPDRNGTAVGAANLKIGQPFTIKVKVALEGDQASISVALDGKPYIAWKGPQSALALHPDYAMPNRKCLGFGAYQSQLVFQSARLRMLSGKAVPLRPARLKSASAKP
ncbi:MAG: hypothetical protein NTU94_12040 [Planctomycetota bacterium]|nr:hypothetical protein [Planctomycetota bacterium]